MTKPCCAKCRTNPPDIFNRWCLACWRRFTVAELWAAWIDYLHPGADPEYIAMRKECGATRNAS